MQQHNWPKPAEKKVFMRYDAFRVFKKKRNGKKFKKPKGEKLEVFLFKRECSCSLNFT